jgi:hypothetical protein
MGRNANNKTKLEIDITFANETPTLAEFDGIETLDWAVEEEVQTGYFISDGGAGYSDVTAGRLTITLTGKRVYGDPAQDYIVGLTGQWGANRKNKLKITLPDESYFEIPCSIEIVSIAGGDASDLSAFETILHSDGAWTYTPASY